MLMFKPKPNKFQRANIKKKQLKQKQLQEEQEEQEKNKNPEDWSYTGECGPAAWAKLFKVSDDMKHQSPINIEQKITVYDESLARNPIMMWYDMDCCSKIKNTGHTFQVDTFPNHNSLITGGPVKHAFHMHWGDTFIRGSEHLIDNKPFAAEIHFVSWNNELYMTPEDASKSNENDGLLVMAKFVKVGQFNPEFEKLAKMLHDIHLKDEYRYSGQIDIRNILSKNLKDYWTYIGSLTTPPCTQCVTWIIFKEPLEISRDQLKKCHDLYEVSKESLCNNKTVIKYNDRPVCKLNDRVVRRSFL